MATTLDLYHQDRNAFLQYMVASLSADQRFVAGWLAGSLARGDADSLSDIDLNLVVAEEYSASLCSRLEPIGDQTSPERLSLFRQFGSPALIHENNHNAPEGGTFTFVLYAESAIMVDWVLVPQSRAKRLSPSKLLFDQVGIPSFSTAVEDVVQSQKFVVERWAFFWMMAAITIKYILRKDGVFATQWIEHLHAIVHNIERQIDRQPWIYQRGSFSQLQLTPEKQLESLKQLCKRMEDLRPKASEFVESDLPHPDVEIKRLLALVSQ